MKTRRCNTCRYYWEHYSAQDYAEDPSILEHGECRRRAPKPRNLTDGTRPEGDDPKEISAYWPKVTADTWCGDFRKVKNWER